MENSRAMELSRRIITQGATGPEGPQGVAGPQGPPGSDGGIILEAGVVTENYTANQAERVRCSTSGGSFTVTAPASGNLFAVVDVGGNNSFEGFYLRNLTVQGQSGQTVMGFSSLILNVGAASVTFRLYGTDWRIVGN
jgi:hypothetical protein